jgi:hypothetical protein
MTLASYVIVEEEALTLPTYLPSTIFTNHTTNYFDNTW